MPKTIPTNSHADNLRRQGYRVVAGVDEVGRGSLAGPVVAAAVVLPPRLKLPGVRDSKLLSRRQREAVAVTIKRFALAVGIGWSSPAEIDQNGLTWAVCQSGQRALADLGLNYDAVILDGKHNYLKDYCYSEAIIAADSLCLNVAAASIVAKVARDNYMRRQHQLFPEFNFHANVGYGTPSHLRAIKNGLSPLHRRLFAPIRLREAAHVN
ncbi:MAG TPA: ribonuclease HII [Candidatus Saccharimonadales bacterium]|nr:ribonuclease HII [Candidatus Saccharimonadales bacterium]